MEAKEQAKELVEKFKEMVTGYVGSSMLTNTEYPNQILANAKNVAKENVKLLIKVIDGNEGHFIWQTVKFWKEVMSEIDSYE